MTWYDWLIVILPVTFVMYMGFHSRRYIRSVSDFLSAGRVAGRYVISVGDVANALSIIGILSYIEVHYKTGFALSFWSSIMSPLGIFLGLVGYCTYRFRETRAMSLGQFLEMRYSRKFRIFASGLRSISEMLANMIMPALAARFFIYILDLPKYINLMGCRIPTYTFIVIFTLTLAISLICMGGTLSLLVTDAIQGMLLYPLLVIFVVFILCKFSWSQEIIPVMMDRGPGESFLNPYDTENLRDFNTFSIILLPIFTTIIHRASWIGAGYSTAAKSSHEQKMAGLLGTWRGALVSIFYVLIAITILTLLNHKDFAPIAREIRTELSSRAATELTEGKPELRDKLIANLSAIPEQRHEIGVDAPLTDDHNLDTTYLDEAHRTLLEGDPAITPEMKAKQFEATKAEVMKESDLEAKIAKDPNYVDNRTAEIVKIDNDKVANETFQQFRTLFKQLLMASTFRKLLPPGLLGMFILLLILAMVSTDDTRIYSASLTITQDCVIPFFKTTVSPKKHIAIIRTVSIGVGIFFVFGSIFMAQLDYINLFVTLVCSFWMGGAGPVMIFGLYSRFGTTAGAWASLLSGLFISLFTTLVQRNWADHVFPFLAKHHLADGIGDFLETVSQPLNPIIVWKMNAVKCPINSYEFYFITMVITLTLYIVVSYLTCKEPFNLERMLHRGKYNIDGEKKSADPLTWRNCFSRFIGITHEYTKGDRIIAWGIFFYSFCYGFLGLFVTVVVWNAITPWKIEWWGYYFLFHTLIVPCIVALISTFWFGIGGFIDLFRLFHDLKNRTEINELDNGTVDGDVSVAEKAALERMEKEAAEKDTAEKAQADK